MSNSSDLPEAGWYVDPANASNERWWGGLEWTDTTRALRVKSAPRPHPAQPVFAGSFPPPSTPVTSTGGFPPATAPTPNVAFPPAAPAAALPPAAPAAAPAPAFAIAAPTSPSAMLAISAPAASTGGFSIGGPSQAVALADSGVGLGGWVPATPPPGVSELSLAAGYGSTGTAMNEGVVSPSWYATASKFLGPTPKNPAATAGLLMSILLAPLGFIFSIVALAKASRIHRDGFAPIGRRRAGWGLALSMIALIAIPIGISVGLPMLQHQQELQLEQQAAANAAADELTVNVVEVPPGEYERTAFEQSIAVGFTKSPENAPESVTCPDAAGKATGESITCEIMYHEQTHTVTMTFTDDIGTHTLTVDGVVQEEAAVPVQ